MGRLLSLDVGDVRVGVGISDESLSLATPIGTFLRAQGRAEREVLTLIVTHRIERVIVGLPLNDDDSPSAQAEKIQRFVERLKRRSSVPFEFVDEYGSSEDAIELLRSSGRERELKSNKGIIDSTAAALFLQRYLDGKKA